MGGRDLRLLNHRELELLVHLGDELAADLLARTRGLDAIEGGECVAGSWSLPRWASLIRSGIGGASDHSRVVETGDGERRFVSFPYYLDADRLSQLAG